jgi:NADH-quinone oxidoreductase subunit J
MDVTTLFYILSALSVLSALMVVFSPNPVKGALFLVATFLTSAGIWIILEAEFLGLILVLVYVGAVMTLFLFVVMMLNLDVASLRETLVRYFPIACLLVIVIAAILVDMLLKSAGGLAVPAQAAADFSNTKALGLSLFTQFVYPFEIAGVILLVAIIAAITLSHRGRLRRLSQRPHQQVKVNPKDRIRILKMEAEKKQ